MNQEHFLIELKIYLRPLSPEQLMLILDNYEQKFQEGNEAGLTEEEVSKSLGKPQEIATKILAELGIEEKVSSLHKDGWIEVDDAYPKEDQPESSSSYSAYRPHKKDSGFIRFCQIAGILALNFLLMIWVVLGLFAVLIALWITGSVLVLSPILGAFVFFILANPIGMFQLFVSIFLCGLGVLGVLLLFHISRIFFHFLKYYMKWCKSVLGGGHRI